MTKEREITGRCFCGAVELSVSGEPAAMGYCHCTSCRKWSAGPLNAFTLWVPSAVRITRGEERVGSYAKTANSVRKWCQVCGGHLMTDHPEWGVVDVFAAVLADVAFAPTVHVNYGETVLRMRDGLPKQKDFPREMGGTGTLVEE